MKESVTYQEILREGEAKGLARGKAEGKVETAKQIALNMLRAGMSVELISQFTGLTPEQIQILQ